MSERVLWMWLSLSVTPGGVTFKKLYEKYPDIYTIYELERDEYIRILTSKCRDIDALCDKSLERAEEILAYCDSRGIGIIYYLDDEFPKLLREIQDPPVLLYYRGVLPDFNDGCYVAVVGTRSLTDYGRKFSFNLAHDLAYSGARIVSGMAIGIDGVAHCGALSAGGITVAVLGCGINVCYPEAHKNLAREIVKTGCVITEYAPNTKPKSEHFPKRNRIISGLCCASIIIEGAESSGAIHTARHARKQGRTIYALPGNVGNKTSEVSNILIRNGAKLILTAEDVIDDFEFVYRGKLNRFLLTDMPRVNMYDELCRYKISCVAPSDGIFNGTKGSDGFHPKPIKKNNDKAKPEKKNDTQITTTAGEVTQTEPQESYASFDKHMLKIYKSIPAEGEVAIEDLCTDEYKIKDVLRILFKLDAINSIEMLPSERVRRKLKV